MADTKPADTQTPAQIDQDKATPKPVVSDEVKDQAKKIIEKAQAEAKRIADAAKAEAKRVVDEAKAAATDGDGVVSHTVTKKQLLDAYNKGMNHLAIATKFFGSSSEENVAKVSAVINPVHGIDSDIDPEVEVDKK